MHGFLTILLLLSRQSPLLKHRTPRADERRLSAVGAGGDFHRWRDEIPNSKGGTLMYRKLLAAAVASTALVAAPAFAQHGPGGGHGPGPAGGLGTNVGGHVGLGSMGGPGTNVGVDTRAQARVNSQGPAHASPTGIAHANINSVLKGGAVVGGPLTGLTTGMTVNFNGNAVGTVQRIVTSNDGTVRRVLVTTTDGRMVSLSPSTLALSGGVLTTTRFRHH
jgi:hypothetical protein